MKKLLGLLTVLTLVFALVACGEKEAEIDYSGIYVGYSWAGEASGVTFEESTQRIVTTLYVAKSGEIVDAGVDFVILRNGEWVSRLGQNAEVTINYEVDPVIATPGSSYQAGTSMFTYTSDDRMSFYTLGVSESGVVALLMVDPITRYQFEFKLDETFDFSRPVSDLTIENGWMIPTVRTAGGAYLNVTDFDTIKDKNFFNISFWSHVTTETGVLEGVTQTTTVKSMLEKFGVTFNGNTPEALDPIHGFLGIGGWAGNYGAIRSYLIGKNILETQSLVDWSLEIYEGSINENNFFGVDVAAGATRTAQNSIDGIAGATVRMSRESTSYQRALVAAGVLDESDVIIGRF